jgi:hypothetical protein
MCAIRFLGARQHEHGVPAAMVFLEGDKALDWDAFLCETGYEASEFQPNPAVKKITVHGPAGPEHFQFSDSIAQLDVDIRGQISVRQFLAVFCGYGSPHSGEAHVPRTTRPRTRGRCTSTTPTFWAARKCGSASATATRPAT